MPGTIRPRNALIALLLPLAVALSAMAQSSSPGIGPMDTDRARKIFDYVEGLDRNRNGELDSRELSDRGGGIVRKIAAEAGIDVSQPVRLSKIKAALYKFAKNQPGGQSAQYQPQAGVPGFGEAGASVPGFGQVEHSRPIPGFGDDSGATIRIEPVDVNKALDRLNRYDTNHDGHMDRKEAEAGKWSDDPFQNNDQNRDGKLSKMELAQRYADRRVADAGGQGGQPGSSSRQQPSRSPQGQSQGDPRSQGGGQKRPQLTQAERELWTLTESMMGRYDVNHNRVLDRPEWQNLEIKSATTDTNGDGAIDRHELAEWLSRRSTTQNLPVGLPDWFGRCDENEDGQVEMSEFSDEWSDEKAEEFARHDRNGDGVIVPEECLSAGNLPEGDYVNHEFMVIAPRSTVFSEIVVPDDDDQPISDLNVQVSITHTHDDYLDVFLIGPEGQRVELFTGVGGSDDHFNNTILDDESTWPIVRGRPPFEGSYRPEGALKNQPSLRQFYGRNITGTWTLMIQGDRSERPGALHGWSLIVKHEDGAPRMGDYREDGPGDGDSRRDFGREDERRDFGRKDDGPSSKSRPFWLQ